MYPPCLCAHVCVTLALCVSVHVSYRIKCVCVCEHPGCTLQRVAVVRLSREVTQAPKRPWEEIKQAAIFFAASQLDRGCAFHLSLSLFVSTLPPSYLKAIVSAPNGRL